MWIRGLSICLALLVVAACGGDQQAGEQPTGDAAGDGGQASAPAGDGGTEASGGGGAPADGEPTTLTLGVLKIAATVPLHMAMREGYFEEEGLDLQLEEFGGGSEILPVLSAGGIDMAFSNHVTTIFGVSEGVDFVCVTGSDNAPDELPDTANILVPPGSDITSLQDLPGRSVAVNSVQSILTVFLRALLDQDGIDVDAVNFVEVPFPNMGDALSSGQVDAIVSIEPFNAVLQGQGAAEVLSPLYHPVLPGVELGCYGFPRAFIDSQPEVVEGFVRAFERGKELAASDRELTAQAINEWTGLESDLIENIVWSSWLPGVSQESMQRIADLMYEFELIDQPFDAAGAVDDSFQP